MCPEEDKSCCRYPFFHCQRQKLSKAGLYVVRKQWRDEVERKCGGQVVEGSDCHTYSFDCTLGYSDNGKSLNSLIE